MGDVAGHGVAAAAVMGKLRHALRAYALEGHSPKEVAEKVSTLMERGEMASVVYMVLDPSVWQVSYINAGQPPPLILEPSGTVRFLEQFSLPLGTRLPRSYDEHQLALTPGSILLFYTDGIIETRTQEAAETKLAKLERVASGRSGTDPDALLARLLDDVLGGKPPMDDVALLAVAPSAFDARLFRMELPALPDSLSTLRNALKQWLTRIGGTSEEIFAVVTAVGEAAANAIEHAYGPGDAVFDVEAQVEAENLAITVRDKGQWRAPRGHLHGRGMEMMRAMMDTVEVVSDHRGTTLRLSHRLRGKVHS
jgi:anti-sigma regulatory factor (Ser/Thr protein kinase)